MDNTQPADPSRRAALTALGAAVGAGAVLGAIGMLKLGSDEAAWILYSSVALEFVAGCVGQLRTPTVPHGNASTPAIRHKDKLHMSNGAQTHVRGRRGSASFDLRG